MTSAVATLLILLFLAWSPTVAVADDGTYDAIVTTESGSYTVPVEVEDNAVAQVYWPNGGDMNVEGADLQGNEASGNNLRGDSVAIEIDDPTFTPQDGDDER